MIIMGKVDFRFIIVVVDDGDGDEMSYKYIT